MKRKEIAHQPGLCFGVTPGLDPADAAPVLRAHVFA